MLPKAFLESDCFTAGEWFVGELFQLLVVPIDDPFSSMSIKVAVLCPDVLPSPLGTNKETLQFVGPGCISCTGSGCRVNHKLQIPQQMGVTELVATGHGIVLCAIAVMDKAALVVLAKVLFDCLGSHDVWR